MSRIFLSFLTISVILLITLNSFAGTEPKVISLDVQIQAHPEFEQMSITTIVNLEQLVPGTYQAVFTQPTKLLKFVDKLSNQPITYRFLTIPGVAPETGCKLIEFDLTSTALRQTLYPEMFEGSSKTRISLEIENFKNVFENTSGRDLTSFFDKWYFQRGI